MTPEEFEKLTPKEVERFEKILVLAWMRKDKYQSLCYSIISFCMSLIAIIGMWAGFQVTEKNMLGLALVMLFFVNGYLSFKNWMNFRYWWARYVHLRKTLSQSKM